MAKSGVRAVLPRALSASHLDTSAVRSLVSSIGTFVFDCDGVLWRGEEIIPGTIETLVALRAVGKRLLFVTNSGVKSRAGAVAKFESLGVPPGLIPASDVVTSAYSAARFLAAKPTFRDAAKEQRKPLAVFLGTREGLGAELAAAGIEAVCASTGLGDDPQGMTAARFAALPGKLKLALPPNRYVAAVVAGADASMTYAKVARAALALQDPECLFVATNLDTAVSIAEVGRNGGGLSRLMMPEAGATVGALRGGTGREPVDCGKGGAWLVELMASEFGIGASAGGSSNSNSTAGSERVAMVGELILFYRYILYESC